MRLISLFIVTIFVVLSCAPPHVAPLPRGIDTVKASTVLVESSCYQSDEWPTEWLPGRSGTGVVISERYVLTASHVVSCPFSSSVRVTLMDGRRFSAVVESDDAVFGSGLDIARLKITSGQLNLHIAPPALATVRSFDDVYYAATLRGLVYGAYDPYFYFMRINTRSGDSGAGIYSDLGQLIGIVVSSGEFDHDGTGVVTGFVPVDSRWLEGT